MYELTRRWVREGAKVEVITAPYEKSDIRAKGFISFQEVEQVQLTVINSSDNNRLSTIQRVLRAVVFSFISSFFALTRKYDVILSSSGPITVGLPMILAKILRGKKSVFEVRDLWPGGAVEMGVIRGETLVRMGWWFEKQCYRFADLVVTVSPGQRDNILSRYPNLNLKVIPNASDNELFGAPSSGQMPNFLRGKKLLTHIGSLGRIHNIEYWLDVAKVIQCIGAKDIHFVFIGEGANRSDLERRVSHLTLENVSFLGLKPKKDLPIWVQHSVATLFATTSNPVQDTCSPNKVFDSFAAGKPIIQTSTGWIKELVKTEQCGINIELNNIRASAEKVIKYVNSPEKLKKHEAHSKRLAERIFDREKLALNYLYWLYQEFNQER